MDCVPHGSGGSMMSSELPPVDTLETNSRATAALLSNSPSAVDKSMRTREQLRIASRIRPFEFHASPRV